jgi:septal ring factor EnvC (AmiA/AmiB activator)
MDYRRQSKELQTQRILADDAEASRFTALTVLIKEEMAQRDARLEAAFTALRNELRDTEHSIAATLGEMDDRQRRLDGETVRPAG